jgi:hypothetical protein
MGSTGPGQPGLTLTFGSLDHHAVDLFGNFDLARQPGIRAAASCLDAVDYAVDSRLHEALTTSRVDDPPFSIEANECNYWH